MNRELPPPNRLDQMVIIYEGQPAVRLHPCQHLNIERTDLEVYRTKYRVDPTTGNFEIPVFEPEYVEDLYDAPSVYACIDCGAETEHYDELTGEWGGVG